MVRGSCVKRKTFGLQAFMELRQSGHPGLSMGLVVHLLCMCVQPGYTVFAALCGLCLLVFKRRSFSWALRKKCISVSLPVDSLQQ